MFKRLGLLTIYLVCHSQLSFASTTLYDGRCHVRGYGDNDAVGPATSIRELQEQCNMLKPVEFRDRTYISDINIHTYSGVVTFQAKCGVRGYGDQDMVGPAPNMADLQYLCDQSKPIEFRDRTFIFSIIVEEHQGSSILFYAHCKVRGYGDNDIVGPGASILELKQQCDQSKPAEFRDRTYLNELSSKTFSGIISYTAKCGVRGYGDQDTVGPAPNLRDLKYLCDESKPSEFRDRTFLFEVNTQENSGSVALYSAHCKVRGYGDNDRVGPGQTILELKQMCDSTKPVEFRDRTYIAEISMQTYTGNVSFKAKCGVQGYGDRDMVGPAGNLADLKFLCDHSKPSEFRNRTFIFDVEVINN